MRGTGAAWGLGAALVAAVGCRAQRPPSELHEAITAWFRAEGIVLDAVRCPQGIELVRGASVDCEATLGSEAIGVTVVVTGDDGALTLRPAHATVVAARAEPEIAQTLRAQGYAVARVQCDRAVWVARAGAEHRCEVTTEDGRRYAWHGVWSGEGTRQRTTVVPLPGVPAAAGARGGAP